ncbi:hypothetical protein [Wolbachia endosymbiont (group B) of Endotricha flammealis]|nr:hypothetical protein [Wolbachia endosymbiont (group B) of Endotricha flammealis]
MRTSRNEKCNLSTLPFGQSLSASLALSSYRYLLTLPRKSRQKVKTFLL